MDGFKCGLEIHQRLYTRKLFCSCFSEGDGEVSEHDCLKAERKLRTVSGERGKVDIAASFESGKKQSFKYFFSDIDSCLVELDEEPPHNVNEGALKLSLQVALVLKCQIVDEIHFMRKLVVDGSNTSGFQRTGLIAFNGKLETSQGVVGIQTICLEEESAGIIGKDEKVAKYKLGRLGIPLVEIATDASIRSGQHAREVAEKIGLMLRSTGKAMRGIGTIRQDVNVSIAQGARVEIKGAQELQVIPILIENEVKRQEMLLKLRKRLLDRKANERDAYNIFDVSKAFEDTQSKMVKTALSSQGVVLGIKLEKFAGLLGLELMPNYRFGSELSDWAKTAGVKGVIHSDEDLAKYSFGVAEVERLKQALKVGEDDAFVLVIGEGATATAALGKVIERARLAFQGVTKDTRKADGEISRFMRPLAGAERMYPETDVKPFQVSKHFVEELSKSLPKSFEEKVVELKSKGLNEQSAFNLAKSEKLKIFEELENIASERQFLATTLLETLTALSREKVEVEVLTLEDFKHVFQLLEKHEIVKAAVGEILRAIARKRLEGQQVNIKALVHENSLDKMQRDELQAIIGKLEDKRTAFQQIMSKNRLRVEARELQELLR